MQGVAKQVHMHVLTWFGVHTKMQLSNLVLNFKVVKSICLHGWTGDMRALIGDSSDCVYVVTGNIQLLLNQREVVSDPGFHARTNHCHVVPPSHW